MKTGKLIVIEGACDGIGKTTQFSLLQERFNKESKETYYHHFPTYNSYQGKPVEMFLAGEYGKIEELSPYFINGLYAMDRAITWNSSLKEVNQSGIDILVDRYTTSSIIYQTAGIEDIEERKKLIDFICDYEYNKLGVKKPDHVIFLYAPFDLVTSIRKARMANDGVDNDIFERDTEYMKKVYNNAMFVADYLNWDKVRCDDGKNMRSIEDIHEEIYQLLNKK